MVADTVIFSLVSGNFMFGRTNNKTQSSIEFWPKIWLDTTLLSTEWFLSIVRTYIQATETHVCIIMRKFFKKLIFLWKMTFFRLNFLLILGSFSVLNVNCTWCGHYTYIIVMSHVLLLIWDQIQDFQTLYMEKYPPPSTPTIYWKISEKTA